jgi:hypothetical protein
MRIGGFILRAPVVGQNSENAHFLFASVDFSPGSARTF